MIVSYYLEFGHRIHRQWSCPSCGIRKRHRLKTVINMGNIVSLHLLCSDIKKEHEQNQMKRGRKRFFFFLLLNLLCIRKYTPMYIYIYISRRGTGGRSPAGAKVIWRIRGGEQDPYHVEVGILEAPRNTKMSKLIN